MDTRLGSRDPASANTPDPVNSGLDTDSSPDMVVIGGAPGQFIFLASGYPLPIPGVSLD